MSVKLMVDLVFVFLAAVWYSTTTLANLLDGRFYHNIQLIPDLPDTVQATCTACASVICDKTTSTHNFIKHIKRKHADVLQSIKWKDCRSTSLPKILDGKFYRNIQPNQKTPGGIQATCTACFGIISGTPKSTGNFISHIRRRHKDIFENCKWYCQTKGLNTWPATDPKPWTWS